MGKGIVYLLIIVILGLAGGLGYNLFQNQKLKSAGNSPAPQASSAQNSPSLSPGSTAVNLEENIQAAINSKNTASLASYMTRPNVNFIIMSSECCQPQPPQEAVDQLEYISEGVPFDFDQNNPQIKNLKAKNERLKKAYVGISKNKEHLIAFTINAQNEISDIEVAVSWKLY